MPTAQETLGPTTTSSSAAAAEAIAPSSSTAAAASGNALRWGYRGGDAAERSRISFSQVPQPPARAEESSGEWSAIEKI